MATLILAVALDLNRPKFTVPARRSETPKTR